MALIDVLGFTAALLTTVSFLPQAIRVLKTRDTSALSLAMYSIFTVGVALWLCYGALKQDYAMILANGITLILATLILVTKVHTEYFSGHKQGRKKIDS